MNRRADKALDSADFTQIGISACKLLHTLPVYYRVDIGAIAL
jgi:hypothetical protein